MIDVIEIAEIICSLEFVLCTEGGVQKAVTFRIKAGRKVLQVCYARTDCQ